MKRFFQRIWCHVLIWTLMLFYLIFAPNLYSRFFLETGKPLQIDGDRPADSDQIKFEVNDLVLRKMDERDIFVMSGWAFSTFEKNSSPSLYDRIIVLTSDDNVYYFPTQAMQRSAVQESYTDLNMELSDSGFDVLISKEFLAQGKYRIGIIFDSPSTGLAYYSDKPARYLVRTPNQLFLSEK